MGASTVMPYAAPCYCFSLLSFSISSCSSRYPCGKGQFLGVPIHLHYSISAYGPCKSRRYINFPFMSSIEFIFLLQILKIVIEDLKYRGADRTVVIVSRGPRQNYQLPISTYMRKERDTTLQGLSSNLPRNVYSLQLLYLLSRTDHHSILTHLHPCSGICAVESDMYHCTQARVFTCSCSNQKLISRYIPVTPTSNRTKIVAASLTNPYCTQILSRLECDYNTNLHDSH